MSDLRMLMNLFKNQIELVKVQKEHKLALKDFFQQLLESDVQRWFHPHPFTVEEIDKITSYQGLDQYYVLTVGAEIYAYGLLRGWDSGFEVPSLGVVINPIFRRLGLGFLMIDFLHFIAWNCGAKKVMLKVYLDNMPAIRLYTKMGYVFNSQTGNQLIGYFDLDSKYKK